jgi:hypothetical protein
VKVAGRWRYVYRAIDQTGQVIDVFVSPRRDAPAARRFFERAVGTTNVTPVEVVTDQAATYPTVLDELLPAARHRTDRYANNRIECDHGRLKARLRPMRGLKQDHSAGIVIAGHAFVQNLRRGGTSSRWKSRCTGGWRSRSTSWPWHSDRRPRRGRQHASPRPDATEPCSSGSHTISDSGRGCWLAASYSDGSITPAVGNSSAKPGAW